MNIYLASSWRNILQPAVLHILRSCGHEVYDFRNPAGGTGFSWAQIDPLWEGWDAERYRDALNHPIARAGFATDIAALQACDVCALLLPSGRSASFELGYASGQGKPTAVISLEPAEPELMYSGAAIIASIAELFDWAAQLPGGREPT